MTVHSGFFNSSDHDRVYDADDFSGFYDGLIFDGVYSSIGNRFYVEAAPDMCVTVESGRAWFDHTWTYNDARLTLQVSPADTVYDRIDAVVLEVNKEQRKNFIKMIEGTPDSTPHLPTLSTPATSETIFQYALAYITVHQNATSITDSDIVNIVGETVTVGGESVTTPLVSALSLAGLPSGGLTGHVLAKKSNVSGDVGWYPIHRLPNDKWYLPVGIQESQVIAAYQFVGRENQAAALKNLVNPDTYELSVVDREAFRISWNAETGFTIPRVTGTGNSLIGLNNENLKSIVATVSAAAFGYADNDVSTGTNFQTGGMFLLESLEGPRRCIGLRPVRVGAPTSSGESVGYPMVSATTNIQGSAAAVNHPNGVMVAASFSNTGSERNLYHNGESLSLGSSGNWDVRNHMVIGQSGKTYPSNHTSFRVTALVLYSTTLTSSQVTELSDAIRALGGIDS